MEVLQSLNEFNNFSIVFRLLFALILGGAIGLERERKTRSAGFRTHSLVCLGATLVMLIGQHINVNIAQTGDVARLGAQVVSGIGFLGAGAIITSGSQKVRGLTTAAALWTCACIGLALGIGFYVGAFTACIFALILLRVLNVVDKKYRENAHFVDIYLELFDASHIGCIIKYLNNSNIKLISLDSASPKVPTNQLGVRMTIKINKTQRSDIIIEQIQQLESVSLTHKVYI